MLVNYRVKGTYLIADRLFEKARLQYSGTSYLDIRSLDARFHHLLPSKVDYSHMDDSGLHKRIQELMKKKMEEQQKEDHGGFTS